jgi:hypothetical protein
MAICVLLRLTKIIKVARHLCPEGLGVGVKAMYPIYFYSPMLSNLPHANNGKQINWYGPRSVYGSVFEGDHLHPTRPRKKALVPVLQATPAARR